MPKCDVESLSDDQRAAHDAMMAGKSIFLTGGAGTGKTRNIATFVEKASREGRKIARLATTGAAAQLIGGQTLHSFFGFDGRIHKPGPLRASPVMRRKLRAFDTLIFDEVSMMRIDILQRIRDLLFSAGRGVGDFAGYQVVMCGDFAQLPPVVPESDREIMDLWYGEGNDYAFQSRIWNGLETFHLETIHRQSGDLAFARWLAELRLGAMPDPEFVNQAVGNMLPGAIRLVATNRMANEINEAEMARIPGGHFRIPGAISGRFQMRDARVPEEIILKPGSRVVICANNSDGGYVNGSTGTFLKARRDPNGNPEALVELDAGRTVAVTQHVWENVVHDVHDGADGTVGVSCDRNVIGKFKQIPLLPGWAITVHRSQGMSLDRLHLDPRGTFAPGQIYVGLSRATSLAGLSFAAPVTRDHMIVDPRVTEYYAGLKRSSEIPDPVPA